jgi:hypothetical protein
MGDRARQGNGPEPSDHPVRWEGRAPAWVGMHLADRIDLILKGGDPSAAPSTSATALEAAADEVAHRG